MLSPKALGVCVSLILFTAYHAEAQKQTKPTQNNKPPSTAKPAAIDAELKAALQAAPPTNQYPDASSIRLLDLGRVTVKPDGTVVGVYRESMKLLNERARDMAEVNLNYNSSYQTIKVIQARTIRKDGTVLEVKPTEIRTSAAYGDYLMYDDAMSVGFSMPGIEDDCVIDYTYQITTQPVLIAGQFWAYWGFSDTQPVVLSRYTLTVPSEKKFHFKAYNEASLKPDKKEGNGIQTYTWEQRNLKPIEREPAMPLIRDVRIWMEITSLNSWQDIAGWFWGLARPQISATPAIRETVAKLTNDKKTPEEKARALYDWVANKTRYVGLEFGISAFKPHPAPDVHKNLYGDCKDKAILLITMLQLAGIKAYPVLLKAGEPLPVSGGLPTLTAFNHCIAIAEIGGKEVWLDATAETVAFGDIPDSDRGCEGFIVREGKGEFRTIPLYKPEENGVRMKTHLTLLPEGGAQAQIEIAMLGGTGQQMRSVVRSLPPSKRKDMVQQLMLRFFPTGKLEDYSLPDGTDKLGAFVMKIQARTNDFAEQAGNLLLVPLAMGSNGNQQTHPFVKEARVFPILQTEVVLHRSEVRIEIPKNYQISEVPKNIAIECPIHAFQRTFQKTLDGKALLLTETVEEKPGKVLPDAYPQLQSYFNTLVKLNKTRLVLKEENR